MGRSTDHLLVLHPRRPDFAPVSPAVLADALKAAGFLGTARGPGRFSAGSQYLGLVTYLGCSPQIALGENEAATTIRLEGVFEVPKFVYGSNLKAPRCPACRRTLDRPAAPPAAGASLRCGHCGHAAPVCGFDWRRSAACARMFIEISNVFEAEAVPGEALLALLEEACGVSWDYCYLSEGG